MDFGGDIGIWQRRLAECDEGLERRNATLKAMAISSCPIASPVSIARIPGRHHGLAGLMQREAGRPGAVTLAGSQTPMSAVPGGSLFPRAQVSLLQARAGSGCM